ncbi:MAG: hypothetical protein COV99_12030 [Bacteroidetes bacterium CG12_big_fil_rev_8_21_14_0_65_60_17]|nr:MAG: hypothetical protein COV99_12030 [Bacteroidetes bacterium CG12_big_fil_rev_8_21_14_0_65_60_17]
MTLNTPSSSRKLRLTRRLRTGYWIGAGLVLLTPLVAMQFDTGVDWGPADFVLFAFMLAGAGGLLELAVRLSDDLAYLAGASMAIGTGFLLIWANLAVGLMGSEDNPLNLLYIGVLATGFLGAIFARFTARGLMRTLFAMTAVVVLIAAAALYIEWGRPGSEPVEIIAVNAVLATLFTGAGGMFRMASVESTCPECP